MHFLKHKRARSVFKWLLILVTFFVFLTTLALSSYFIFEKKYSGRIYPNIYIGEINLGAKTLSEARETLNQKLNQLNRDGVVFSYQNKQAKIFPTISSVETDLAYEIINFNIEKTINKAFTLGRKNDPIKNLQSKISIALNKKQTPLYFSLNEDEILKILKSDFSKFEIEPENANLKYENNTFFLSTEKLGNVINYKVAINTLRNNLEYFNSKNIVLSSKTEKPTIFKIDIEGLEKEADTILKNAPLLINLGSKTWTIGKNTVADWLEFKKEKTSNTKDKIFIVLNKESVIKYFKEFISPDIKVDPQNAKFEVKDGRVIKFQQSKDGLEINLEATLNLLNNKFLQEGENNIFLATTELKSSLQTQDVNDLGIREIIGTGHSVFSGSPKNRRHNIAIGAAALNGLIIKPNEEFSLMTTLGEIDAESGYLPELVIKGDKTIAEYGGGLCQIGTTLFRTVIQSGLPVTMRRNHSYRVSYYEPAGTDATIYDPWPDFKFINDSNNNILIQTRIEGDDIYFDFWGTKDGRKIEITDPTIYNITKPAPTKLIETLNLPVGEKKCTERAHNGADAYFDYTVTYSKDNIKEKRFSSHYIPWREVCLIGVEKLSDNSTSSSTEEIKK